MTPTTMPDVHAALASPIRRRLLQLLRDGRGPRDARELAEESGLNQSTVRFHLDVLPHAALLLRNRTGRAVGGQHVGTPSGLLSTCHEADLVVLGTQTRQRATRPAPPLSKETPHALIYPPPAFGRRDSRADVLRRKNFRAGGRGGSKCLRHC